MVFEVAMPNILAYIVSLVPVTALTALMHGQAFGLFDDGFSDLATGISRMVRYLTAPPPDDYSEPESFRAMSQSDYLLYYWSTFIIRLAFGSFIVAILVGAYNQVIALEAELNKKARRDASLPEGFTDRSARGILALCAYVSRVLSTLFLNRAYGMSRAESVSMSMSMSVSMFMSMFMSTSIWNVASGKCAQAPPPLPPPAAAATSCCRQLPPPSAAASSTAQSASAAPAAARQLSQLL